MVYRSEPLRRAVAGLPCQHCGRHDATQAAHRNEGKAMGMKTSDALIAALCVDCHRELDQGRDMSKAERRDMWNRAAVRTYQALIESGVLGVR